MSIICSMEFENSSNKTVYAGEVLRGTVKLTLPIEKQVRGVFIRIHGESYCYWDILGCGYTDQKDHLKEKIYLIGGPDGDVQLTPGEHIYTFQCSLPSDLPASVEHDLFHIRYTTNVVVNIPRGSNVEFKERFTVLKQLDLNTDPTVQVPISVEDMKICCSQGFLCCFLSCFSSKSGGIIAKIPFGGYTPGQTIHLEIHVKSGINQKINGFEVKLIKKISFHVGRDKVSCKHCRGFPFDRSVKYTVIEKLTQGCAENSSETIRADIDVPTLLPTNATSDIVDVTYYIEIKASLDSWQGGQILRVPIVIGTNPIQNSSSDS